MPDSVPPTDRARLHIVSGPTGAGKSTLLLARGAEYARVLLPWDLPEADLAPGSSSALHYNLLRLEGRVRELRASDKPANRREADALAARMAAGNPFEADDVLARLRGGEFEARASVLVVPKAELLRRAGERTVVERLRETKKGYDREFWGAVLRATDLPRLYARWLEFLGGLGIPVELLESAGGGWRPLASLEAAGAGS